VDRYFGRTFPETKVTWQDPETLAISDQLISEDTSKEFVSSMTSTEFLHRLLFKDDLEDTYSVKVE
jgi:hypothetical protein